MCKQHDDSEWIKKEDWKKALGVIVGSHGENSALSSRDYKIQCEVKYCITMIKGYFIWWCSAHHQPLANCEKAKSKLKTKA